MTLQLVHSVDEWPMTWTTLLASVAPPACTARFAGTMTSWNLLNSSAWLQPCELCLLRICGCQARLQVNSGDLDPMVSDFAVPSFAPFDTSLHVKLCGFLHVSYSRHSEFECWRRFVCQLHLTMACGLCVDVFTTAFAMLYTLTANFSGRSYQPPIFGGAKPLRHYAWQKQEYSTHYSLWRSVE